MNAAAFSGRTRRRASRAVVAGVVTSILLSGCAVTDVLNITQTDSETASTSSFFENSSVHELSIVADEAELSAALDAYAEDGSKEWVEVSATIDGTTYDHVGLRLKGNSSLRGTDAESDPAELPWLIRLNKYIDGQQHAGRAEYVVRQNNTESSLNEAVALALVGEAGLETEAAAATRFSVNGSDQQLRLVIDAPDDELWSDANFDSDGITYEAESEGDYTYRGDEGADYTEAFTPKSGETDDLTPIAEFLDFVNNSTDEEFAADLDQHLDVQAFATYLAIQDLVVNTDDIDGPGNNSFLRYDAETGLMKVVTWDMNLAFGTMGARGERDGDTAPPTDGDVPRGDGAFPRADGQDGQPPEGFEPPEGTDRTAPGAGTAEGGQGPGAGGPRGGDNPLVERFLADDVYADLYAQAQDRLHTELVSSGLAEEILSEWSTLLTENAADLVDPETVADEAASITEQLSTE